MFTRWVSILAFVAIALGAMPTWRTDGFFEIKRVREFSIGVLHEPVLSVRDVLVPVSRGASDWTRLSRRIEWEPFGASAIALLVGIGLLGAAQMVRCRSRPLLVR